MYIMAGLNIPFLGMLRANVTLKHSTTTPVDSPAIIRGVAKLPKVKRGKSSVC